MLNKKIFLCIFSVGILGLSPISYSGEIILSDQLIEQLKAEPTATRSLSGGQTFGANVGRANMNAIQFEYNSAQLTDQGRRQVDELARAMNQLGSETFQVIGHTDATGSDEYNKTLSQRRADAVYNYLVQQHGINPNRLQSVGMGESSLFNSQNPGAAENRRVEAVNTKVLN